MLAGTNTSWGDPGTNRYSYSITTTDATAAAGVQVKVNGSALLAGENLTFNGAAETNGSFYIFGGYGTDILSSISTRTTASRPATGSSAAPAPTSC